jgi:hypothetical protein
MTEGLRGCFKARSISTLPRRSLADASLLELDVSLRIS